MKRHFVQLAQSLNRHSVGGWYWSEKLDGMRCFWDGGLSTGKPCSQIPWANMTKAHRLVKEPVASGLWSRYGHPIYAPKEFTDQLPQIFLDGELYAGRGNFQLVTSTVKEFTPGPGWARIKYHVFDSPSPLEIFAPGSIKETNFTKEINCLDWVLKQYRGKILSNYSYYTVKTVLQKILADCPVAVALKQTQLPFPQKEALAEIERQLDNITAAKGEGLVLRNPATQWEPTRNHNLLKVKKYHDAEGVVVGYYTGEATDLGSKLLGMMGALVVSWKGKTFKVSGFTDAERELNWTEVFLKRDAMLPEEAVQWAKDNPGTECPGNIEAKHFPRGSSITFKYRELTNDGIPREASYLRKRDVL